MKVKLTEDQLKKVLKSIEEETPMEVDEQETTSSEPSSGTSSTQSGGQGYPQVGKWESGVTRGPANQIGVTKWSEIVGANIKRGKANPLK